MEAEAAGEPVQYQPVLDALNALGRTPWQVNTDVLPIVEEVWARGGGIAESGGGGRPVATSAVARRLLHPAKRQATPAVARQRIARQERGG